MQFINEVRAVRLSSRPGATVEGRERIVGVDARWAGRGVVIERHAPVEVVATSDGGTDVYPIPHHGPAQRLLPYLAAPVLALIVRQLLREKG